MNNENIIKLIRKYHMAYQQIGLSYGEKVLLSRFCDDLIQKIRNDEKQC